MCFLVLRSLAEGTREQSECAPSGLFVADNEELYRCTSGPHRCVYSRPSCSNGVSSSNVKLRINLGPLFDARSLRKTLADACGFCSCRATQGPDRGISQALQNVDLDRGEFAICRSWGEWECHCSGNARPQSLPSQLKPRLTLRVRMCRLFPCRELLYFLQSDPEKRLSSATLQCR